MIKDKVGIPYCTDYVDENLVFGYLPEAIFTDVNDTIIKTEYMTPSDVVWETVRMPHFKELIEKLAHRVYDHRGSNLDMILITGNSFDYVRGRLEPYRLREIPKINWVISAENGLVTQDLSQGIPMWWTDPSDEYQRSIREIRKFAERNYIGIFYYQGNQIRTTFKPSKNRKF